MNDDVSEHQSETDFGNYFVVNDIKASESEASGFDKDSYDQNDFQDDDLELSSSLQKKPQKKQEIAKPVQKSSKYQEEMDKIERERQEVLRKREVEKNKLIQMMKEKESDNSKTDKKTDGYKYFQQKFGMGGQDESEDDDIEESNEMQIDTQNAPKGEDKFEDSEEEQFDDEFDQYQESHESNKFTIHMEKSNQHNPFKDKALVTTLKQETFGNEIEIKMKDDIQSQSEIGFDDEIEDRFSEQPIESEVEQSKDSFKSKKNDQGGTMMMGSVVTQPKMVYTQKETFGKQDSIVNMGSVVPQNAFYHQPSHDDNEIQDIQEDEQEQSFNMMGSKNDSMRSIKKHIEDIKPKWSPKNTKDDSKAQKTQKPIRQPSQNKKEEIKKPIQKVEKQPVRVRPQTAVPTTTDKSKQRKSSAVRKPTDTNNKDLSEVMNPSNVQSQNQSQREEEVKSSKTQKSTRLVIGQLQRPESAITKPKVGYDGKPNLLGNGPSTVQPKLNTNDLTAQLAKSKKFQMIKKLKEEKERKKDMVVRNLQKANVIQNKQKEVKKKQAEPKIDQSQNDDDDEMFGEVEEIKGDQAAFANFDNEGGMDRDADDFLNDSKRESVKDLKQKKQSQPQTEKSWVGNALGSGQFQSLNQQIDRDNVNMQLQPQKQQKPAPKEAIQKEQGWNARLGSALGKGFNTLVDTQKSKQDEAKHKFNELVKEKKDRVEQGNKDVLGFMMDKQQRQKNEKKDQMEQGLNKLVKDFDVGAKQTQNKGSDKVPEHAKLVIDNEGQLKEIMDLKKRLKELHFENKKIQGNVKMVEKKKREVEANLDRTMQSKNLVSVNGRFEMQSDYLSKGNNFGIKFDDIPDYDKLELEKANPLDSVVKKIEDCGYNLEQAFILFDDNGDEVLTIKEIKEGLINQNIELNDQEMMLLIQQIDANNDGVLTMQEWIDTLSPKVDIQREYNLIMQGLNIDDPLVLEERILDLKYRLRRLGNELEVLRETRGLEHGFDKNDRLRQRAKNPLQKQLADKIKELESDIEKKAISTTTEKDGWDAKIKDNLMKKDMIHQDYYQVQRLKERQESEYSMRLGQIQDHLNVLDNKLNEGTQNCLILKNDREQLKQQINRLQIKIASMCEMETRLDKQLEEILGRAVEGKDLELLYELDLKTLRELNSGQNEKFDRYVQHCASVTIQRRFKGFIERKHYKLMKFGLRRLVRRLEPLYLNRMAAKKYKAAVYIQRLFRRYKSRKDQLERIQKKNQMRKLLEEEDEKYKKSEQERQDAARLILKKWRQHKAKAKSDLLQLIKSSQRKTYGTAQVVYLPAVKRCIICKKSNGQRQCPNCNEAIYCESCYIEYHSRGHRKTHTFKRIRFGTKQEEEEPIPQQQPLKENKQPNTLTQPTQLSSQPIKSSLKMTSAIKPQEQLQQPEEQKKQKGGVKFSEVDEVKTIPNVHKQPIIEIEKIKPIKKQVKLNDDDYIKSLNISLTDLYSFDGYYEETMMIRLGEFEKGLGTMMKEFNITQSDIDRICEITRDKCKCTNPSDTLDVMEEWVDIGRLKSITTLQAVYAQEQGNMMFVTNALNYQYEKMKLLMNPALLFEKLGEVYDTFTQNEKYKNKMREQHEKYGTFRSGEGTIEEITNKIREAREQQEVEEFAKSKQIPTDMKMANKLYKLHEKNFKLNAIRNDGNDLIPHHKLMVPLSLSANAQDNQVGRLLAESSGNYLTINQLVEPYPNGKCYNNGQLSNQTQRFYLCTQATSNEEIRVNQETFNYITSNNSDQYSCRTEDVQKEVCVCPQGYYDYQCMTGLYTKCYINITNPPFYKGCDKPDSFYYMYSIHGYDPCYFFDFNKAYDIKFKVNCKYQDTTGLVTVTADNVGYAYRDVIVPAETVNFDYQATNPNTKFSVMDVQSVDVSFDFRDWKWLSQKKSFRTTITDPQQLVGNLEKAINIDFSYLSQDDSQGLSSYIVGGRAYFEANLYGLQSYSFTTKGFFDQEGYVEPKPTGSGKLGLILGLTFGGVAIIVGIVVFFYCRNKKKIHHE